MTTKVLTCHIAICDDCKAEYEEDYTPHWPSAQEAVDDAESSGEWWSAEGVLLCNRCRYEPHAFVPSDLQADDCKRCDNPEDEHESVSTPEPTA
jgi:hypothetical protein